MKIKNAVRRIITALVAIAAALGISSCNLSVFGGRGISTRYNNIITQRLAEGKTAVQFLNVGQADCSLICMPDGRNILIDAGNEADGEHIVKYLKTLGLERIDYLIATHPHEDHIGGMDDVVAAFDIGTAVMPYIAESDLDGAEVYEKLLLALKNSNERILNATAGLKVIGEDDVRLICLAPYDSSRSDLNDYSATFMFSCNGVRVLFTGDAEEKCENEMLSGEFSLKADVLSVGHHGSKHASSKRFLEEVNPLCAVISCGKNNSYGHPHEETLERLSDVNAAIYRTDRLGSVVFFIDKNGELTEQDTKSIDLDGNR